MAVGITQTANPAGVASSSSVVTYSSVSIGTAKTIAWGSSFEAKGVALPLTTVASKVLTVKFIYDTATSKWGCVSYIKEA